MSNKPITKCGSSAYYLTKKQLRDLRIVCKYTRLSFHAMAARPEIAKQLINDYLNSARG
jgi:hypothetical protein